MWLQLCVVQLSKPCDRPIFCYFDHYKNLKEGCRTDCIRDDTVRCWPRFRCHWIGRGWSPAESRADETGDEEVTRWARARSGWRWTRSCRWRRSLCLPSKPVTPRRLPLAFRWSRTGPWSAQRPSAPPLGQSAYVTRQRTARSEKVPGSLKRRRN